MLNDLLTIRRIKEGDINTFEAVFRSYYNPLCLFSTSITGRMDVAEEIIQELFYVIWRDRNQLQIFQSFKGYLYSAVRNRSLQYLEHLNVRNTHRDFVQSKEAVNRETTPEEELEYKELENIINNTLKKMPERRSKIFKLHRFEKKKYSEIADSFSISIKTVEAEMTKALQSLRTEIEHYTNTL